MENKYMTVSLLCLQNRNDPVSVGTLLRPRQTNRLFFAIPYTVWGWWCVARVGEKDFCQNIGGRPGLGTTQD